MTMAAPHCTCESVIRVGVCELCGSLGKRQWDLLREARDGWREKAEAPHPPALDAEGRERLEVPEVARTAAYQAVRAVAKGRSHHAPEPDSVGLQGFARAAVDAVLPYLPTTLGAEEIRRLETIATLIEAAPGGDQDAARETATFLRNLATRDTDLERELRKAADVVIETDRPPRALSASEVLATKPLAPTPHAPESQQEGRGERMKGGCQQPDACEWNANESNARIKRDQERVERCAEYLRKAETKVQRFHAALEEIARGMDGPDGMQPEAVLGRPNPADLQGESDGE